MKIASVLGAIVLAIVTLPANAQQSQSGHVPIASPTPGQAIPDGSGKPNGQPASIDEPRLIGITVGAHLLHVRKPGNATSGRRRARTTRLQRRATPSGSQPPQK